MVKTTGDEDYANPEFDNNLKRYLAYRNMPTESYEILSAAVMVSKSTDAKSVSRRTTVTFDGKKKRAVAT